MKDEHFDRLKRIGICYWEGNLERYFVNLLNHNSEYFDVLYLITDLNFEAQKLQLSPRIHIIPMDRESIVKRCLGDDVDERVLNKLVNSTSAMISDLLCYTSTIFLKGYYERVMYFDLNTLLWNPFMINEIFSINKFKKSSRIRLFEEEGVYLSNKFSSYLSSDFSVVDKECDLRKIISDYLISNIASDDYCLLGPIFLNGLRCDSSLVEILAIEPNSLDPLNISRVVTLRHKPHSIGVTMSNTQYKSIGYKINDIIIYDDNTCKVYFELCEQE